LLLIVLFISAHISTYYYEKRWIALGRKVSEKLRHPGAPYEFK
jgi:hypothetical protein